MVRAPEEGCRITKDCYENSRSNYKLTSVILLCMLACSIQILSMCSAEGAFGHYESKSEWISRVQVLLSLDRNESTFAILSSIFDQTIVKRNYINSMSYLASAMLLLSFILAWATYLREKKH